MKHIKGEPRKRNAQERQLRALASHIRDQKTLDAFLATFDPDTRLALYHKLDLPFAFHG